MILNYKFENFMSFRENVEFSMLAPKTKVKNRFPNNYTTLDVGIDVLKTAVVVGENAGGKSNFVRSLSYLQSFFVKTEPVKAYRGVINTNSDQDFCPKKNKASQSFEIEIFMEENILYLYRLEIDFVGIAKEAFYYKDRVKSRYKKIFSMERDNCTIECREEEVCKNSHNCHARVKVAQLLSGPESESKIGESLEKSSNKEKMLGLTIIKYALLGNEHAIAFTDWIKNDLCPKTNIINYDIYKSMKNEEEDLQILCDARYLDIFRMIDYSIIDFKVDEEKPFSKTMIVRQKRDGSTFARELAKDSSGVREFFAWAVQIFKVVYENKTVFADEID